MGGRAEREREMFSRCTYVVNDAHQFVEQTLRQIRVFKAVDSQTSSLVVGAIVQISNDGVLGEWRNQPQKPAPLKKWCG